MSQALPPEMGPKGKVLSTSVSTNDWTIDTSSDSQRKRQFVDEEGFIHPPKPKTAKVGKSSIIKKPVSNSNTYETLAGETVVAEPSGVSGNVQSVSDPRSRKMPPIVVKFKRVNITVLNSINAQTSGQIIF